MNLVELIKSILTSNVGSFTFLFGLGVFGVWSAFRIGRIMEQLKNQSNDVAECKKKHQEISDISSANKSLRSDLDRNTERIDKKLETLATDVTFIKTTLTLMRESKPHVSLTESHSPVSLTEKGKEIASDMQAEEMIAKNWEKIKQFLDKNIESKNAYDIQQLCIETATAFIENLFEERDVERLKNYAFLQGQPLAYYGSMLGVIIRDKYFEEMNLKIEDIDK